MSEIVKKMEYWRTAFEDRSIAYQSLAEISAAGGGTGMDIATVLSEAIAALQPGREPLSCKASELQEYGCACRWEGEKLADICDAHKAAIQAPAPVAVTWQPIETAPMDGTPVDLWVNGTRVCDCKYVTDGDGGEWQHLDEGWYEPLDYDWKITHWMPVPALPETALSGQEGK